MYQEPYGMWGQGSGSGVAIFVLMILFWILVVGAILYFVRHSSHSHSLQHAHHPHGPFEAPGSSPVDILKMRFAKGEIDEEEYAKRLKHLEGN
jgi:putative membrane protein